MIERSNPTEAIGFDIIDYLKTPEDIAEYLNQVMSEGDPDELTAALGHIARLHGMTKIAKDSGLGRESLYKALKTGSQPRFDTVQRVFRALQIRLVAVAEQEVGKNGPDALSQKA